MYDKEVSFMFIHRSNDQSASFPKQLSTYLYIEGTSGVHVLAQVGGDELRSEMPSDVSSVFSVDIHGNIIKGTSLGSVF